MKIHDPMHVAQLAATLLSSHGAPEKHHIKIAINAAVMVLDEALLRAEEDEAKAKADEAAAELAAKEEAEKPADDAGAEAKT